MAAPASQFKGVSWDKVNEKWVVQIRFRSGKTRKVGRFGDEIAAAQAL